MGEAKARGKQYAGMVLELDVDERDIVVK